MARPARTFAGRSHTEAKAGENIGQSQPCEDVTEKTKQTNQQEDISGLSLTRSPRRFVGVLWLLRWCGARFRGWCLSDRRTWREGVLSLKHRRCNETNKYHSAQQSPHENDWLPGNENPHGRTSEDEERLTVTYIILRKAQTRFVTFVLVLTTKQFPTRNSEFVISYEVLTSYPRKRSALAMRPLIGGNSSGFIVPNSSKAQKVPKCSSHHAGS
jgi:hypothetical protein